MNIRVVTVRYSETLGGFPDEPLHQVLAGGNVVEQREYCFTHRWSSFCPTNLFLDRGSARYDGRTADF